MAFSPSGRYMLSRDYLTVKLWDLCMTGRGPVETFPVHSFLSQKLCTLYENDCIFDKFEILGWDGNGWNSIRINVFLFICKTLHTCTRCHCPYHLEPQLLPYRAF